MSQATTWSVPIVGPATPTDYAARDNAALNALLSCHSGNTAPPYAVQGTIWLDTSGGAPGVLKRYTGSAWLVIPYGTPTPFSATGGDEAALPTTLSNRLAVDFVATGPTIDATVQCTFNLPATAGIYCYIAGQVLNQTTGGTVVVANTETPGMITAARAGHGVFLSQRVVASGLTIGSTYRVWLRARINTGDIVTPQFMRIAGVCQ